MLFGLYTPILVLQAFCLYHAYKTRVDQKWFYLIIFIPFVGCLLYLYDAFYSRRNLSAVTEGVKTVLFTNYNIEKLESELTFSDNVTNRRRLADEYMKHERYADAAALYERCLEGFMADDPAMKMRLLSARYYNKEYEACIAIGDSLRSVNEFRKSEERITYAWALHHANQSDQAAVHFSDMNRSFTNHTHRKEYARFLMATGKGAQAKELLDELVTEFDQMKEIERRVNRDIYREVRGMRSTIEPSGENPATS